MLSSPSRRLLLIGAVATVVATSLHAQVVTVRSGGTLRQVVAAGANVAVPVVIDLSAGAGTNVASLSLNMNWGASRLQFDSLKAGSFGSVTSNLTSVGSGSLITSVFDAAGTSSTVTMGTAYFTAPATSGGTRISFTPTAAGSATGTDILSKFRARPLDVCVAAPGFWGDANGDDAVNIIDAQQIARYSVGLSVANENSLLTQGDVNADNDVNIIDAQQIARFSVDLPAAPRVNTTLFVQPAVSFINLGEISGVKVGGSAQLNARLYDSLENTIDGCVPVTWSSDSPAIATVDSTGRVFGVSSGMATITVAAGGVTNATSINVGASFAASLAVVAGDQQWGYTNNPLPVAGQFVVRDAAGDPVVGAPVTFTVTAGTIGSGAPVVVKTDANGIATATSWIAPTTAGTATMQASVGGQVPNATIDANIIPAPIGQTSCAYDGWSNRCWGNGTRGQLGNGSSTSSGVPVAIIADLTAFRISSGSHLGDHFCGLDASGAAYCWGSNSAGQLGDGSRTDRNVPTAVAGNLTFAQVSEGTQHTCAVTTAGDVYCWGVSTSGQVGDSTIGTSRTVPTKVKTPAGIVFTQVSAAFNHSCATSIAGDVYCWGTNSFGQLGDGTINASPRPYPALITGGVKFTKIATGPAGGCGLTAAGAAWCWGGNFNGQLGNGTLTSSAVPVLVQGGHVFSNITMGVNRTCGEKTGEFTVWCWGANSGALGDGTLIDHSLPTLLPFTLTKVSQFGFGSPGSACALGIGGSQVFCWGGNASGQQGDGTNTLRTIPRSVVRAGAAAGAVAFMQPTGGASMSPQSAASGTAVPTTPVVSVWDGANNPVAGVTVSWSVQGGGGAVTNATTITDASGFASSGGWTLGAGVGEQRLQATVAGVVVNGSPAPNLLTTFIAYGTNTPALAVKLSGDSIYSANNNGGNASASRVPQVVKVTDAASNPIPNVAVVFAVGASSGSLQGGATSTLVVTDASGLAALPDGYWIPNSALSSTSTLTATVAGLATPLVFTQFRANGTFDVTSCALTAAGAAMCTGSNQFGGIGDGTTTNRTAYTPVSGGLAFTSFAEGISGTKCGLVGTTAYCWGLNSMGEVGDSTQVNRLLPTLVKGGLSFTKLFTQMYTTCGLTSTNQLYCWGWTGNPGWGEGEALRGRIHLAPTLVNTGGLTFTKVGVSDDGMCGLTARGDIYCKDARYRSDGLFDVPTTFIKWNGGPWSDLAVGNTVACALDAAGHAFCVGGGPQGGSGLGSNNGVAIGSSVPTEVLGGISFADIHAGNFRACGRRSNGELYCWGIAPGNGSAGVVDRPVLVPGLNVSSVRIPSFRNECAKTTTSLLYCWGVSNSAAGGSVGDGTTIDRYSPVAIPNWPDGPPSGVAVAMYADIASYTQLVGTATTTAPSVTVRDRIGAPVSGVTVTFTAATGNGTVVGGTTVTDATGVATVGSWTMPATPGTARLDVTASGVPTVTIPATVLPPAASVTILGGDNQFLPDNAPSGAQTSVVVKDAAGTPIVGTTVTWTVTSGNGTVATAATNTGSGGVSINTWSPPFGLGTNYTMQASVPGVAPVSFTTRRMAYQNSGASNPTEAICRIDGSKHAWCWGGNGQGAVGDGSTTNRTTPTPVALPAQLASLAEGAYGYHNCAVTFPGAAYCWGNNEAGQLGDGSTTTSLAPVAVAGGLTFSALRTGPFSTCGLTFAGELYCWGWGGYSFRGDNEFYTIRTVPTLVITGGRTFTSFGVGLRALCALDAAGQAFCWGENFAGQLGTGNTTYATTPVAVASALRFSSIAEGRLHTCATVTDATVACWGTGSSGAVGTGGTSDQLVPAVVAGVTGALDVHVGEYHSCARTSSNIFCWGANSSGQLGDGSFTQRNAPVQAAAGITPRAFLSFTRAASCVTTDVQQYCWGGTAGGIGDGTASSRSIATVVPWVDSDPSGPAAFVAVTPSSFSAPTTSPQTVTVRFIAHNGASAGSGRTVTFVVTSGGGVVSQTSVVADLGGNASTTWTLAGASGAVGTLEVRYTGIPTLVFTGTVP